MKKRRAALILLSLLVTGSMVITGCSSKPLPPVFEGAHLYHEHYFESPPAYRCITSGYQDHAYSEGWPFEVNLNADLPETPDKLDVYEIIIPTVDEEYACNIARQMGYDENLMEILDSFSYPSNGYRFPKGHKPLEVYEDGTIAVYNTEFPQKSYNLPTDQECIDIAWQWLDSCGLYPQNVIRTETFPVLVYVVQGFETIDEFTAATSVTFRTGIDGYELYGMGANVLVGDNGEVIKAMIKTPEFKKYSTVSLQQPQAALDNFQSYLDNPQQFWEDTPQCLLDDLSPVMFIDNASLVYFCMTGGDAGQPVYAQPVYIFEGQGYEEDGSEAYSFTGRVDAVVRQEN